MTIKEILAALRVVEDASPHIVKGALEDLVERLEKVQDRIDADAHVLEWVKAHGLNVDLRRGTWTVWNNHGCGSGETLPLAIEEWTSATAFRHGARQ